MKKLLGILMILAIKTVVIAQKNFVKAIVIGSNGDSSYGNIDYRNWKNNPETISFINDANQKQTFDPSSIKGFYIPSANESYTSFSVQIDMIPGDPDEAIANNFIGSPSLQKKVFLLQLLRHPSIGLYQYTDNRKEHFYYLKNNDQPVELIHHYLYNESTTQLKEVATYREQLSKLFEGCQAAISDLPVLKFTKDQIQRAFIKYLQCTNPGSGMAIKKEDETLLRFGIVAGAMANTFNFEGTNATLVDENYTGNTSPLFGISLDLALARNFHKWHFVNELIYKRYKTGSSFTRPYNLGYTVTSDVGFDFSYAQINTLVRRVFGQNAALKPYINLGIGNAYIVAENKNTLHNSYSFGREENMKALEEPNKYEFSFIGGIGLMARNIAAEVRYGGSKKGFSRPSSLDVNAKSYQFILTYQF